MTRTRTAVARTLRAAISLAAFAPAFAWNAGCLVDEKCFATSDCPSPKVCTAMGRCGFECADDAACGVGFRCLDHVCKPVSTVPVTCPGDMAAVASAYCVDKYEASRADATGQSRGEDESVATSRAGVLPWQPDDNEQAQHACEAAGKTLCTPAQWKLACEGSRGAAYGYGDTYEPATCNGIDTFGPGELHLMPTGWSPTCKSEWGVLDINGNLWERTLGGDETTVRGGAYNCIDSKTLHRCDYVPQTWTPSALGFRCCLVPDPDAVDAGAEPDGTSMPDASLEGGESGCIEEDSGWPDVSEKPISDAPTDQGIPDSGADATEASADAEADTIAQQCPPDMVRVTTFCIDVYEASHSDATPFVQGTSPVAASQKNVQPWMPVTLPVAREACQQAGKRLCRLDEWVAGCSGTAGTAYSYGNAYDPAICNGIDTYCDCAGAACGALATCPYPHCYNQASTEGAGPCGANFHMTLTGTFASCVSEHGAYDVNGNVWELTDTSDGLEHFRGGAYNCGDSEALHRCDHDGSWGPSARGFRCCGDLQ